MALTVLKFVQIYWHFLSMLATVEKVEWGNEYIIFSAGKGFKVDDLEVDLPNNINVPNSTTNNDINMGIAPCGLQIPQSKLIDSLRKRVM